MIVAIRFKRGLSISARLTLLYTLGAMAAVALFAALVNWKLAANFTAEHLRFVQSKAAELQTDLNDAGGRPQALLAEIFKETAGTRLRQYQARLLDGGSVLGQTPGMDKVLPASLFALPAAGILKTGDLHQYQSGGRSWLLGSMPLHAAPEAGMLRLQLAYDITRDRKLLTDFHRALAVFFLLLVPLLIVTGRWISSRALAPVTRMARAVGSVTPSRLSTRIPEIPPWPPELSGLVDAFNRTLSRLEEAFTRLSRFSADLAHELRTPLSNLSGEFEVCLTRPRQIGDYRATLESGLEECHRLNALIENLLFLARAEHAVIAMHREYFDAAEAAGWVIAQHAPGATARDVRIDLKGKATVYADLLLFRQALSNVLANAVRYAPSGSTVKVEIQSGSDGSVELCVTDHGDGIAAQHLPHLFERFYRVDPARDRSQGQGTGLGLSIVHSILEVHDGSASIDSAAGIGTEVRLRFPSERSLS